MKSTVARVVMRICLILVAPNLFHITHGVAVAFNLEEEDAHVRNSSTSVLKKRDICASCIGSNSTCRVVSGIFSSPQLSMGYNLIAHIPRGACNLSVTEMRKSPNHLALKRKDGSFIFNGNWKLSQSGEYQDAGTPFHYSRQTLRSLESISSPGPIVEPLDIMLLYQQPNPIIRYEYVMTESLSSTEVTPRPRHYTYSGTTEGSSKVGFSMLQHPQHHQAVNLGGASNPYDNNNNNNHHPFPYQFQELVQTPTSYPVEKDYLNYHHSYNKENERKFVWKITGYTNCTEVCAGGTQTSITRCVKSLSGSIVGDKRCPKEGRPSTHIRRCNLKPCPAEWVVETWSKCSNECGDGIQTRSVTCHQKISQNLTMQVTEGACLFQRPLSKQPCKLKPCNYWQTSNWSQCSTRCGSGVRNRTVICVGQNGNVLPNKECDMPTKPDELKGCNMGPCEGVEWFVSNWSQECSQYCGAGIQTRHVVCSSVSPDFRQQHSNYLKKTRLINYSSNEGALNNVTEENDEFGNSIATLNYRNDASCDESGKPPEERECLSDETCEVPSWFTGSWGKCSSTCGSGTKTRQVLCLYFAGGKLRVAPEGLCTGKRPAERQSCTISETCPPRWFTTEWSECSVSCGGGVKRRSVSCRDSNWTVPSTQCSDSDRPVTSSSCNEQKCMTSVEGQLTTMVPMRNDYNNERVPFPQEDSSQSYFDKRIRQDKLSPLYINKEPEDKMCSDQYQNCALVVQARLCRYRYYRSVCCRSCWGSV